MNAKFQADPDSVQEPPWSAHDLAEDSDQSLNWTWSAPVHWREAEMVTACGSDSITGAAMHPPDQIRSAQAAEARARRAAAGVAPDQPARAPPDHVGSGCARHA